MKNGIVKIITIGVFLTLVLGFVAYKAGYFEKEDILSHLDKSYALSDSTKRDSINKLRMMYSSKSIIMSDESLFIHDSTSKSIDSSNKPNTLNTVSKTKKDTMTVHIDSFVKANPMMYSSKSAIIFKPDDFKINFDSIQIDTNNRK